MKMVRHFADGVKIDPATVAKWAREMTTSKDVEWLTSGDTFLFAARDDNEKVDVIYEMTIRAYWYPAEAESAPTNRVD